MQKYLNKGIKEIIEQFPETGVILNEFNIGCVQCNSGTCMLKDIVEVHNLSSEDERMLLQRIGRVIYPDTEVEIPAVERKVSAAPGPLKYSPPIRRLVDEHFVIKKLLSLIPSILEDLEVSREEDRQLVLQISDFIRSYADQYHHAKEEDILFREFDEGLDILKVMHEEHRIGRGHVKAVLAAIETCDNSEIADHLMAYGKLLREHIKKEDELLYPWMDRNLSTAQIGELYRRCAETDERFRDTRLKQEGFVEKLEERFIYKEETNHV